MGGLDFFGRRGETTGRKSQEYHKVRNGKESKGKRDDKKGGRRR